MRIAMLAVVLERKPERVAIGDAGKWMQTIHRLVSRRPVSRIRTFCRNRVFGEMWDLIRCLRLVTVGAGE
jgi:hypothetical protein